VVLSLIQAFQRYDLDTLLTQHIHGLIAIHGAARHNSHLKYNNTPGYVH
jgi:hypothetical protein